MGERPGRQARASALSAGDIAWIALLPCALVTVAALLVLGPPLGHLLFARGADRLWPPGWWEAAGHAEPAKEGRYVVAALAPGLLVVAVLLGVHRQPALRPWLTRALRGTSWVLAAALVAVALLNQHPGFGRIAHAHSVVGPVKLLVSVALVALAAAVLPRPRVRRAIARLAGETRRRRTLCLAAAAAFAAIWVLRAVTTDGLSYNAGLLNLPWTMNDAIAVLDGRTPLVDYHAVYAKLFPYATAAVLGTFGTTTFVYTTFMAVLDGLTLLAVYAIFRRVARRSLLALALFAPFVATSDLDPALEPNRVGSPMTMSAMWPMRYGGAYLLAWLTVRHLGGARPRRAWSLFLVGGLVAINSVEIGAGAVVATAAALVCARPPTELRALLRLAAEAAAGLVGAAVIVTVGVLARTGQLPDPHQLTEWPSVFAKLGLLSLPLHVWGLHLALYATFVAAVTVAAVRLAQRAEDRLLTGMLAWSGVFGLLAGAYVVGRPDLYKLTALLSAWAFALMLLLMVCVRSLAARGWRRPTLPELLVLFGFAVTLCSLSQLSTPEAQISRLLHSPPGGPYVPALEQFVGAGVRPGDTVALLVPMGYRISHDLALRNVAPYAFMNAIVTKSQMRILLDTLTRDRVSEVFVLRPRSFLMAEGDTAPQQLSALTRAGFAVAAAAGPLVELKRR